LLNISQAWDGQPDRHQNIEERTTMIAQNTPRDGDFASLLEGKTKKAQGPATQSPQATLSVDTSSTGRHQTVEDVLVHGEDPTEEFLDEWNELNNLPKLSDEEFERQALNAPGDDGDINTPE
jgi:hypothetical protein